MGFGAEHPRVVMVSAHDPFVGVLRAASDRYDIVERDDRPFEFRNQVHASRARAYVVGERQGPAPVFRRLRPAQSAQKRLCIAPRDREHRDLRNGRGLVTGEGGRARDVRDVRRFRCTSARRIVSGVSPLTARAVALRPVGICRTLPEAVVARIRVDDAADGSVLGRDLRLDAPPGVAVTRDYDLAAHVDASPGEFIIVLRHSVVHVHELTAHVAVDRIGIVQRKRRGRLPRSAVLGKRLLSKRGLERDRRGQFQDALDRRREQRVKPFDVRLEAERREKIAQVDSILGIVRRAEMMRMGRQVLHPNALIGGGNRCVERGLASELGVARWRRKTQQSPLGFCSRRRDVRRQQGNEEQAASATRHDGIYPFAARPPCAPERRRRPAYPTSKASASLARETLHLTYRLCT